MNTFLGLDLAWRTGRHTSALTVLEGDGTRVDLVAIYESLDSDEEILTAIHKRLRGEAVLAIDAPLVISNRHGQRACETEIGRRFGHAHASAHTANLGLFPIARGVGLARLLIEAGWAVGSSAKDPRTRPGRRFFEVYPHPAHVVLFDLPRIIKYKKGPVARRKAGLSELRHAITSKLGVATPCLGDGPMLRTVAGRPLGALGQRALKTYEDALDSLLCAYIAAHYWTWGGERNEIIGTPVHGCIVTPSRTVDGRLWSFERLSLRTAPPE